MGSPGTLPRQAGAPLTSEMLIRIPWKEAGGGAVGRGFGICTNGSGRRC